MTNDQSHEIERVIILCVLLFIYPPLSSQWDVSIFVSGLQLAEDGRPLFDLHLLVR